MDNAVDTNTYLIVFLALIVSWIVLGLVVAK